MEGSMSYVPDDYEIETASGTYLDLASPDPTAIRVLDVGQGLARTDRYAGQTRRFYSVAEHAVRVQQKLMEEQASVAVQLAGLHHDDAEAFIGDVSRPLKLLVPGFRKIEERVQAAIAEALELPTHLWDPGALDMVKNVDDWALSMEAYYLMPSKGQGWWCEGLYKPARDREFVLGWDWQSAMAEYLHRHRLLSRQVERQAA